MTAQELILKVIEDLEKTDPKVKINALHLEMLNECCDVAINSNKDADEETLIFASQVAFSASLNQLKNMQEALKQKYGDDTKVNFTYKNHKFEIITKNN